jgi:hypothetical protein
MKELQDRLIYTIDKSNKISKHFDSSSGNNIHFFCLYMLERLNFSASGLHVLSKEMQSKTQLEYSAGIITRTVLLDYMIVLNAHVIILENIKSSDEIVPKLDEFCSIMLSDCLNHTIKDIEKLRIPQTDLIKLYKGIVKAYPDSFEEYNDDGSVPRPKISKRIPAGKLFEKLFNSKELRKYADVYQAYLFYSKYDHFGKIYYDIIRDDFSERFRKLNEVVKIFPRFLMFTLSILVIINPSNNFLEKEFNESIDYNDSF